MTSYLNKDRKHKMKYLYPYLLIAPLLFANENLDLENDFLNSLDEVSEIATKTKLNIDDTPSFVSVLNSEKLKKLGVNNVFEALNLVPGVQLKKESSGVPIVTFRGVTQKSEVKLMVDGVTINNSYRGSIYYYLDFPIEMIKRIEVIRGAGSILYGSGAISGVINIITNSADKSAKNNVFISTGTYSDYKGGALVSTNIKDFRISLDSYYQKNNKSVYISPNSSIYDGSSDRHLEDYSIGVNISNEYLSLIGRIKKSNAGNAYGILGVLDTDKNNYDYINNSFYTQLSYKNNLSENNNITLLVGYSKYIQDVAAKHPSYGLIDAYYEEGTYFNELTLISNSIDNNELLIGAKIELSDVSKSSWLLGTTQLSPVANPDLSRDTTSIYINDKYSASPDLDISAGLRYDNYSDFGDSYSPNIGLVYRVNKYIRLKGLYSHSFRAPSWVELTSNTNLEAETSNSMEAGIIFKQNQSNRLRVNFYISKINKMITKDVVTKKYIQNSYNKFYGSELEYIYSPNNQTEINIFSSYIIAEDEDKNDLADVANILASTSLTYQTNLGISFGSLLKYVSSSSRSITDTRDDMDDSLIFDQTISYSYNEFSTSLIIKDLFDSRTYYSLPQSSYETDFDDTGRVIMLKASMEF